MDRRRAGSPDISYIMAAHDAAPWVEAAIASALAQRDVSVEVVVVDDSSQDDTLVRVQALAARDSRVRVTALATNRGPAAARNVALREARGAWIGVLDADDLLAPERSRCLLNLAEEIGCVLVADDALRFLDQTPDVTWPLLGLLPGTAPIEVGIAEYLMRNRLTGGDANLGFLKPLIKADFLARHGLRYDEHLRIGEDFDLCLRCLAAGAALTILPQALYRYRVVDGSLSRRLKASDLHALQKAYTTLTFPRRPSPDLAQADAAYRGSLDDLLTWTEIRELLGRREWARGAALLARGGAFGAVARTLPAALTRRLGARTSMRAKQAPS
ncbi:glycosyltransferase family 2 protein [uncultured Enterovirga sp.]|uniref:glycosyltransferase family 2 protein n=1 Tax=uncultured Enterovirga sp. TaxID=2026352 RepID=UPI0035CB746B